MSQHPMMNRSADKFLKTPDGSLLRYKNWMPLTSSHTKPRILLLQGRATFTEKFTHFILKLRMRGYEVWTFDWRGQGLSTRELGRKGYIDSFDTYVHDLHYFITTFLKNEEEGRPLILLGHSMGGHVGLRYLSEFPTLADGAIMTAPMIEINTGAYPKGLAYGLCRAMDLMGMGKSFVFGHGAYDPTTEPFEGNLLTYNQEIFYEHRRLQLDNPDLVLGSVTFKWVQEAMKSSRVLLQESYLKNIQAPVEIITASEERVVDNSNLDFLQTHISLCRTQEIPNTRHQLLSEFPEVQQKIVHAVDHMVDSHFASPYMDPKLETSMSCELPEYVGNFASVSLNPVKG